MAVHFSHPREAGPWRLERSLPLKERFVQAKINSKPVVYNRSAFNRYCTTKQPTPFSLRVIRPPHQPQTHIDTTKSPLLASAVHLCRLLPLPLLAACGFQEHLPPIPGIDWQEISHLVFITAIKGAILGVAGGTSSLLTMLLGNWLLQDIMSTAQHVGRPRIKKLSIIIKKLEQKIWSKNLTGIFFKSYSGINGLSFLEVNSITGRYRAVQSKKQCLELKIRQAQRLGQIEEVERLTQELLGLIPEYEAIIAVLDVED